jgi:deoxycytidylate deaminase
MKGKCAKQTTIAVIETNSRYWIGTNWCYNAQNECPRKDMPTGVGYELCEEVCDQNAHAEVDACKNAGRGANGGTLYLLGHTYCCDNCKRVMNEYGIKNVVIGKLPESIMSKIVK